MSSPLLVASSIILPTVTVGPNGDKPLSADVQRLLLRTVVDSNLHQPDMFALTFLANSDTVVTSGQLSIGTTVQIAGAAPKDMATTLLITGEVTSIEAICENLNSYLVVRGYDLCHRLQRVRRSQTFVNMTDSDIASKLAKAAGFTKTKIDPSTPVHDHIGQVSQSDWDFLKQRAREIGFETGISAGTFYFRKASTVSQASGQPLELTFRSDLWSFRPRVSAANITPKVEVRVWDPMQGKVIGSVTSAETGTATTEGNTPSSAAEKFVKSTPPAASQQPGSPAVGNLGPAPQSTGFVVHHLPVATGSAIDSAATKAATALAERVTSTFAEAEGEALGNPKITAGAAIKVASVSSMFAGPWIVTSATHVYEMSEGGYNTHFVVSGRQDRSLLSLTSAGSASLGAAQLSGVYCAVVTNVNDSQKLSRVKVALPWLSPDYETDWAPVVQVSAGKRSGAMFLPEVSDEVLVGFEFGDPRRPYVIGGIVNSASKYTLGGQPVKASGQSADVVFRGLVSSAGNRLVFNDEVPPSGGPPTASAITLGTGDGKLGLQIDQVAGTITITCEPAGPNSKAEQGTIDIKCGNNGKINIATGSGGTVSVDGGSKLDVKAQAISIQSSGELTLKGSKITLN